MLPSNKKILNIFITLMVLAGALFGASNHPVLAGGTSCDGAGEVNQSNTNGLRHVTYNCGIWLVRYFQGIPYLQWSPRDVSAAESFPGQDEVYGNYPGVILPNYPIMQRPQPRNLVTHEFLDVVLAVGNDGYMTVTDLPADTDGQGNPNVMHNTESLVSTDITLDDGTIVTSSGDGSVTATNDGIIIASGSDGQVAVGSTIISVPSNGAPAVQPDNAVGLGSGGSMSNPAHEDVALVCEPNGSGKLVCHKP